MLSDDRIVFHGLEAVAGHLSGGGLSRRYDVRLLVVAIVAAVLTPATLFGYQSVSFLRKHLQIW